MVDFRWHKTTRSPHWYEIVPAPAEGANTTGTTVGSVVDPVPSTLVAQEVAVRQAGVVSTEDPDEL